MTFYVYGNETDVLLASDSLVFESTGSPGVHYDDTTSRCAVQSTYIAPSGLLDCGQSLTTFWFGGSEAGNWGFAGGVNFLELYTSTSTLAFRVLVGSVGGGIEAMSLQMQYLSAAGTFTSIGDPYVLPQNARNRYDVKVSPGVGGSAELYVGGTRRASGSADMTYFSSLRYARTKGAGTNWWSGFMIADEPTVGVDVITAPATGDGTDTGGVGSYAYINEAVSNDAAFNTFSAAGQVRTYDHSTDLTGRAIIAVGNAARAKCGVGGPQNAQLVLRSGGSNHVSSTKALSNGYGNIFGSWALDPNGDIPWTAAAVNALQFGMKAVA